MPVTPEFQEASARACIRALRGLESTAITLEAYAAETFPPDGEGKVHFGRVLMESAAVAIRDAWKTAIREVEHFPTGEGGLVEKIGDYRAALGNIADLEYPETAEAGEPLDNAIAIARKALEGRNAEG